MTRAVKTGELFATFNYDGKVLGRCIYKPKHQIKKCQLSNKTYSQGCQICHGKIRNRSKNKWKYHITKTC